jgi:predicted RNase H-like HicB family nuclease
MIYIDELVEPSSLTGALTSAGAELRAINPNAILVSAGPMEDRDAFFTNLDRDNRARAGRCGEVFGGPSGVSGDREVLFATPTPDTSFLNVNPESSAEVQPVDRSQYAPERYGLPKILGGFEVVAVVGGDTNPCTPADAIIVYLQGVDATYKDYQQGDTPENASMALEELVKLYPKAAISIGSPIEDMEAFFRVLEEQKIYGEQAMARGGCEPLGGPIILDPTYETVEAPVSEPFQMIVTATPMK